MNLAKKTLNLRIFDESGAEGAANGAGAEGATGDSTNQAGGTQPAAGENNTSHDADGENGTQKTEKELQQEYKNYIRGEGKRFFDQDVQNLLNKRFKEFKTLEGKQEQVLPLLQAIASDYGIENVDDIDAIVKAYVDNDERVMSRASKSGLTLEQQKQFDSIQRERDMLKAKEQNMLAQQRVSEIQKSWEKDAQEIREKYDDPDFSVESAFQDEEFFNLVTKQNVPFMWAYKIRNEEKINAKLIAETEKKVTDNIKARGLRISETAAHQTASANQSVDVSKLSREQLFEYAERAAKGETIDFKK